VQAWGKAFDGAKSRKANPYAGRDSKYLHESNGLVLATNSFKFRPINFPYNNKNELKRIRDRFRRRSLRSGHHIQDIYDTLLVCANQGGECGDGLEGGEVVQVRQLQRPKQRLEPLRTEPGRFTGNKAEACVAIHNGAA
jgi:hypothetical protein